MATSYGTTILSQKEIIAEQGYSEIIIPLIKVVLKESSLSVNDLSGFLVCTGPGNYTSLRVAISTVRGLALASGKQACGISLFELMATEQGEVLVIIKAPAEKLYVQKFSDGLKINPPKSISLNEIEKKKEYFDYDTIGFNANKVGKLINCRTYSEFTRVSFNKFFKLGRKKLKQTCPRPTPLYVK